MALRTPLYDAHAAAGATFTEFAGYDMPVHYGSIKEEHHAVRTAAGLFDVSHMSNLWVTGPGAAQAISHVCPFDAAALPDGKGKYTVFLEDDGTILDDAFVFKVQDGRYHVVPNAGRNTAVAQRIRAAAKAAGATADVQDVTRETAIFALQGPKAREVLQAATPSPPPKFHHLAPLEVAGVACMASGTGYTGEKGCELYVPAEGALRVWEHLMKIGHAVGIRPVGLGARDTLRLEKGYCLAGNEFAGGRTPVEAGLEWIVDWTRDFAGKPRLLQQRATGEHDRLVGLVQEKGIPRHGYPVVHGGAKVGEVTSGTLSPTLEKGIALAYVRGPKEGDTVAVEVRGKPFEAKVVKPPFVA